MRLQKQNRAYMRVLTKEKIERIYNASMDVAETIGFKIYNKEALGLLNDAGAHVCQDGYVKIPSHIIERAISCAPRRITIYDQNKKAAMYLGDDNIYFGNTCDTFHYLDPYTDKRIPLASEHVKYLAKIGDYLKNIDFVYTIGLIKDYEAELCSRMSFLHAMENTSKPINFTVNDAASCKDIIALCQDVAGGAEQLRSFPYIFQYCEPIPPLVHDNESLQKLLDCAAAGVPLVYLPYGLMGGTTPMSFAGTLVQLFADIFCGLVIHQAKAPHAPFIIGAMPATMDMKSTIGTYATPEMHMLAAAASEISSHIKVPFYGTAGCTDAKLLDYQAIMETTMTCFSAMMSKTDLVHDVGFMDSSNMLSPELIVLADEIISALSVYRTGVSVNDNDLVLDVIEETGIGGNYITCDHTLDNYRNVFYSDIFDRSINYTLPSANQKIKEKTIKIIEEYSPKAKDKAIAEIMNAHREKWIRI